MTSVVLSNGKTVSLDKLQALKTKRTASEILSQSGFKNQDKLDKVLIILLDTSGSMREIVDMGRMKIEAAWDVFRQDLVPNLSNWPYGVLTFGISVQWEVYPTKDTSALVLANRPSAMGGTEMGRALGIAWGWVKQNAKQARFILISDGVPTDTSEEAILTFTKENSSIPIDTVGIGTLGFSLLGSYNPEFLRRLSEITGGIFSEVTSAKALGMRILELSPSHRPMLGTVKP